MAQTEFIFTSHITSYPVPVRMHYLLPSSTQLTKLEILKSYSLLSLFHCPYIQLVAMSSFIFLFFITLTAVLSLLKETISICLEYYNTLNVLFKHLTIFPVGLPNLIFIYSLIKCYIQTECHIAYNPSHMSSCFSCNWLCFCCLLWLVSNTLYLANF